MGKKGRRGRLREGNASSGAQDSGAGRGGPPKRVVVPDRSAPALRAAATIAAGLYLASLFLSGAGSKLPRNALPATALYFVQTTCLFPHAARMVIDYRLEGWQCAEQRFVELDVRPHFPIHADDKESRFQRLGYFHRRNRPVMQALEQYVVERENARTPGHPLGGIRLSSLRLPFPELGDAVPRFRRLPLEEHAPDRIKHWYYTPRSRRTERCTAVEAAGDPPEGRP
jgi:hypothetical protein